MAEEGKTQVTSWTFREIRNAVSACVAALTVSLTFSPAQAEPAEFLGDTRFEMSGPAMWLIEDEDTELYLFGSVHALPPELDWQRDEFIDVMNTADIIFFETTTRDSSDDFLAFFRMGIAGPGESLHDVLNTEQLDLLADVLADVGLDLESFRGQKPWFASLMISFAVMDMQGAAAEDGVEAWMERQLSLDRDVRSLENALVVAESFSELTTEEQIDMLMDGLGEDDMSASMGENMLRAWMKGNPDGLYRGSFREMSEEQPNVYEIMITRRNTQWAETLDALMDEQPGRILVVVGAGHLAGPESVILMMEELGWAAEQF